MKQYNYREQKEYMWCRLYLNKFHQSITLSSVMLEDMVTGSARCPVIYGTS